MIFKDRAPYDIPESTGVLRAGFSESALDLLASLKLAEKPLRTKLEFPNWLTLLAESTHAGSCKLLYIVFKENSYPSVYCNAKMSEKENHRTESAKMYCMTDR